MTSQDSPVLELYYEILWLTPRFQQLPPAMTVELAGIPCTVESNRLVARPAPDRSNLAKVRAELEEALDIWALELELDYGWRLGFRITGTARDEPPIPGQTQVGQRGVHEYVLATDTVCVRVVASLPLPTGDVASTPEVLQWLDRLRSVRDGREPAPGAAQAMLTDLQTNYGDGSPAKAAAALHVTRGLLVQIAKLAGGYHPTKGRKTKRGQLELTDSDLVWLERAMTLLLHRLAELAARGPDLPELTVDDVS